MRKFLLYLFLFTLPTVWVTVNLDAFFNGGKFVYPAHQKSIKKPLEKYLRGVSGTKLSNWNTYGLRGPEFGKEKIRILTIGNSLSECLYLDDSETWQTVLQKQLSKLGHDVTIYDASLSGILSAEQIINVLDNYEKFNFDLIIFYPLPTLDPTAHSDRGFSRVILPDLLNERLDLKNNRSKNLLSSLKKRITTYLGSFKAKKNNYSNIEDINGKNYSKRRLQKQLARVHPLRTSLEKERLKTKKLGLEKIHSYLKNKPYKKLFISELSMALLNPNSADISLMWGHLFQVEGIDRKYSLSDERAVLESTQKLEKKFFTLKNENYLNINKFENITPLWFYDHHHFNVMGSKKFAFKLAVYVDQILKN